MIKQLFDALTLSDSERAEITEYYSTYHKDSISPLSRSLYDEFKRTGRRIGFEDVYFDRRRRLAGTFMMCRAYGDRYLDELCALIYAVCDEETWALPAHTAAAEDIRHEIDLFAAETAMTLKEMAYLMGGSLPEDVRERIDAEITERVINVFESRRFGWETAEENWSAVCAGCIGIIYLYNGTPVPERIMDAMRAYLRGIAPDGACMEGPGYYSYGFGYYVYFAALLREFTGRDILSAEKVMRLAAFQSSMYLCGCVPSYSDSDAGVRPLMGLTNMLGSLFPEIPAPDMDAVRNDECGRWAPYIRSYLYKAPQKKAAAGEAVYESSQLYICRRERFSVFIKGGHNAEPHNHNDIGSLIITDNRRQLICDIGCGEYTGDYFNDEKRYSILTCSSLGHSVPIINGKGQKNGRAYRGNSFSAGGGRARLDISGAYEGDITLIRELEVTDSGVILRDRIEGAESVTERLITDIKPRVSGGATYIDNLMLDRPASVTKEPIKDHSGCDRAVYLLDFAAGDEFVLKITMKE